MIDEQMFEPEQVFADRAGDVGERLTRYFHLMNRVHLKLMDAVAEAIKMALNEQWEEDPASYICTYLGMGYNKAKEMIEVSMMLDERPAIREAFAAGKLSYDHLRGILSAYELVDESKLLALVVGKSARHAFRVANALVKIDDSSSVEMSRYRYLKIDNDKQARSMFFVGRG